MTELARASLLVEHVPGRYTWHDLLRAYATELTHSHDTDGDRAAALTRLLDHYTHTACAANRLLYPALEPIAVPLQPPASGAEPEDLADHRSAMAWLSGEHANLLAAIGRAAQTGRDVLTWQLAWGLHTFQYRQSHWPDLAVVWQAGLAAAHRLADQTAQAYAHRRLGDAHRMLGRPADSYTHLQAALRIFTGADDRFGEASVHLDLSMLAEQQSKFEQGLDHAEHALALARVVGHERQQASALNTVGWFHALLGQHTTALTFCRQALALNLRQGNAESTAYTLDSLGYAYQHLGDHTAAVESFRRALAIYRELGFQLPAAESLVRLGDSHQAAGHADAARAAWTGALHIFIELDHPWAEQVRGKLSGHDRPASGNHSCG